MLRNPERYLSILESIHKNPGLTINDICKKTNTPKTTCTFYLKNFETKQQIKSNSSGKKRFFSEIIQNNEIPLFVALRTNTTKDIIKNLMKSEMQTFSNFAKNINKSKSTISIYLKKLIDEDIVQIKIKNNEKIYFLTDKNRIEKLFKNYNF